MYEGEAVQICFADWSSEVMDPFEAAEALDPCRLAGRVVGLWRSCYEKIVIEAEVI
jgi:hypothetical protein